MKYTPFLQGGDYFFQSIGVGREVIFEPEVFGVFFFLNQQVSFQKLQLFGQNFGGELGNTF